VREKSVRSGIAGSSPISGNSRIAILPKLKTSLAGVTPKFLISMRRCAFSPNAISKLAFGSVKDARRHATAVRRFLPLLFEVSSCQPKRKGAGCQRECNQDKKDCRRGGNGVWSPRNGQKPVEVLCANPLS